MPFEASTQSPFATPYIQQPTCVSEFFQAVANSEPLQAPLNPNMTPLATQLADNSNTPFVHPASEAPREASIRAQPCETGTHQHQDIGMAKSQQVKQARGVTPFSTNPFVHRSASPANRLITGPPASQDYARGRSPQPKHNMQSSLPRAAAPSEEANQQHPNTKPRAFSPSEIVGVGIPFDDAYAQGRYNPRHPCPASAFATGYSDSKDSSSQSQSKSPTTRPQEIPAAHHDRNTAQALHAAPQYVIGAGTG